MSETTISELMSRDPQQCTREDIEAIVSFYRASRKQFAAAAIEPKAPKKKPNLLIEKLNNLTLDL